MHALLGMCKVSCSVNEISATAASCLYPLNCSGQLSFLIQYCGCGWGMVMVIIGAR